MAHNPSARKRLRQSEARRVRNRSAKSEARTLMKRVLAAVEAKDGVQAQSEVGNACYDRACIAPRSGKKEFRVALSEGV